MVTYPISCAWKGQNCVGQMGTVEFPDETPYPGDTFYGFICDGCVGEYQASLSAEQEAARIAREAAQAEALARLNAGEATLEDVRLLLSP